jgi:hypothetical protein
MNRKHTRDDYLRLIGRLRDARPDIALSSDFIVGFPGESAAEFEDTLDLIRRVGFMQAYSFGYSPRPGTAAATSAEQVTADEKDRRLQILQAVLTDQQVAFNVRPHPLSATSARRGRCRSGGPHRSGADNRCPTQFPGWQPGRTCFTSKYRGARLRLTQIAPAPAALPSPARLPPVAPAGKSITLQFADNALLQLLVGDHDRYLARIEQLARVTPIGWRWRRRR